MGIGTRDRFAMAAQVAVGWDTGLFTGLHAAERCYQMADAMQAARPGNDPNIELLDEYAVHALAGSQWTSMLVLGSLTFTDIADEMWVRASGMLQARTGLASPTPGPMRM